MHVDTGTGRGRARLSGTRAAVVAVLVTAATVVSAQAALESGTGRASASPAARAPLDPEVVLPLRVAAGLERTLDAVDRSSAAVDDRRWPDALRSLAAARRAVTRAHLSGVRQLQAPPAGEEGEESTAGPDSVGAVLTVEQDSVARLSVLYAGVVQPKVVAALTQALSNAQVRRAAMLAAVVALPEEAGAPYADALIDTVPLYGDEVACLTEALADDPLTAAARSALRAALARSKQAEATVTAAFGGAD